MSRSNTTPSDDELAHAITVLQMNDGDRGWALDRVVLMLQEEWDRRERARKLLAIMEKVGDHCTIQMARGILERGEHV